MADNRLGLLDLRKLKSYLTSKGISKIPRIHPYPSNITLSFETPAEAKAFADGLNTENSKSGFNLGFTAKQGEDRYDNEMQVECAIDVSISGEQEVKAFNEFLRRYDEVLKKQAGDEKKEEKKSDVSGVSPSPSGSASAQASLPPAPSSSSVQASHTEQKQSLELAKSASADLNSSSAPAVLAAPVQPVPLALSSSTPINLAPPASAAEASSVSVLSREGDSKAATGEVNKEVKDSKEEKTVFEVITAATDSKCFSRSADGRTIIYTRPPEPKSPARPTHELGKMMVIERMLFRALERNGYSETQIDNERIITFKYAPRGDSKDFMGFEMRPEKFTTQMIRESEDFAAFRSQGKGYLNVLVDTFNALKARRSKYVTMLSDPNYNRGELIEKFFNATAAMQELIEMSGGKIKFQFNDGEATAIMNAAAGLDRAEVKRAEVKDEGHVVPPNMMSRAGGGGGEYHRRSPYPAGISGGMGSMAGGGGGYRRPQYPAGISGGMGSMAGGGGGYRRPQYPAGISGDMGSMAGGSGGYRRPPYPTGISYGMTSTTPDEETQPQHGAFAPNPLLAALFGLSSSGLSEQQLYELMSSAIVNPPTQPQRRPAARVGAPHLVKEASATKFDRGISKSEGSSGINSSGVAQTATLSAAVSASAMTNGSSMSAVASSSTSDDMSADSFPNPHHGRSG